MISVLCQVYPGITFVKKLPFQMMFNWAMNQAIFPSRSHEPRWPSANEPKVLVLFRRQIHPVMHNIYRIFPRFISTSAIIDKYHLLEMCISFVKLFLS